MSSTDNKPLVSIGLPVYNGEDHLRQTLDLLLAQDYEDFELIISDNASEDDTRQICLEYASKDSRVQYHRNATNIGITGNFNRVFELSSGELFMWASHDDVWEPNFVSSCAKLLRRHRSAVLCYPRAKCIGPDGELRKNRVPAFDTRGLDLFSRLHAVMWGGPAFPIYGLIRKTALERTHLWREILGTEYMLRVELALLGTFALVPATLFQKRLVNDQPPSRSYEDPLEQAEARGRELEMVDEFMKKINKPVTTKWSALRWFGQMVYGHAQIVNKHVPGYGGKALLIPSVVLCTLVKYHRLLKLLLELSEHKQRGKG